MSGRRRECVLYASVRLRMQEDNTLSFVRVSVGKGLTVSGNVPVEEQFRELAEYWRDQVRADNYNYLWLLRLKSNVWRYSAKMRCWLARECLDEMSIFYGGVKMADQKGKGSNGGTDKQEWGFVNVTLTDEQREAARLDYGEWNTLWDILITVLKDGYKFTVSYDSETDSYCAALSGTNCGKPNERLTLTAWGESEIDAMMYVLYKHVTVLQFEWQRSGSKPKRLG